MRWLYLGVSKCHRVLKFFIKVCSDAPCCWWWLDWMYYDVFLYECVEFQRNHPFSCAIVAFNPFSILVLKFEGVLTTLLGGFFNLWVLCFREVILRFLLSAISNNQNRNGFFFTVIGTRFIRVRDFTCFKKILTLL